MSVLEFEKLRETFMIALEELKGTERLYRVINYSSQGSEVWRPIECTSELLVSFAAVAYWLAARSCSLTAAVGSTELTATACRA